MIELTEDLLIGRGTARDTYRHPHQPDLVLKVDARPVKGRLRWYERPPRILPSYRRELEGYAVLLARLGHHHDFISRVYGLEETNLGPAILAENALFGFNDGTSVNSILRSGGTAKYSLDEIAWAKNRYAEIARLLCDHKIYIHGLKPESMILCRKNGALHLRMIDYKTLVYRQLVSPRFVPFGQHHNQMSTVRKVLSRFDRVMSSMAPTQSGRAADI